MGLIKFGEFNKKINLICSLMEFRDGMLMEEKVEFLKKSLDKFYLMPAWNNRNDYMLCFTEEKFNPQRIADRLTPANIEILFTSNQRGKRENAYGLGRIANRTSSSYSSINSFLAYKYVDGIYDYYYIYGEDVVKAFKMCIELELSIDCIIEISRYSNDIVYKDMSSYKPKSIGLLDNSRIIVGNSKRKPVSDLINVSQNFEQINDIQYVIALNLIPNVLIKNRETPPYIVDIIPNELLIKGDRIRGIISYKGYSTNNKKSRIMETSSASKIPESKDKNIMTEILKERLINGSYSVVKIIDRVFGISEISLIEVVNNFESNRNKNDTDSYEREMKNILDTICSLENTIDKNKKSVEMLSLLNKGKLPIPYIIIPQDSVNNYEISILREHDSNTVNIWKRNIGRQYRLSKLINIKDSKVYLDMTKGDFQNVR